MGAVNCFNYIKEWCPNCAIYSARVRILACKCRHDDMDRMIFKKWAVLRNKVLTATRALSYMAIERDISKKTREGY